MFEVQRQELAVCVVFFLPGMFEVQRQELVCVVIYNMLCIKSSAFTLRDPTICYTDNFCQGHRND